MPSTRPSPTGITAITVDLINLGTTTLDIRLAFEAPGGRVITSAAKNLPVNSGWQSMTYPVEPADLGGGPDPTVILAGVTKMWLFHNTDPAFPPGQGIVASLGVDNIQATPEPVSLMMLVVAGGLLMRRRRD